jgi:hypothetical protein
MYSMPKFQDMERAFGVTWYELAQREPRLEQLLWDARAAGACCRRDDVERIFAPFRDAMAGLVGFQGRHRHCPVLGSVGAYEVTYWRLYDAVTGLLHRPTAQEKEDGEAELDSPSRHELTSSD